MARYELSVIIESDDDFLDGEQIEDLRNEIEMAIADYNCFVNISGVKVREIN